MRKTTIQLILLSLAGAIIFWREWVGSYAIGESFSKGIEHTIPPAIVDFSSNSIIWLIVIAVGVLFLTEMLTRYFKMSSPNSV